MAKKVTFSKLYRSEADKVVAGVCGGLGEYFEIDPVILRIILVVITLFGGSGLLLYLILWIVIPSKSQLGKSSEEFIKGNVEEIKEKTKKVAGSERRPILGLILIILGIGFLLNSLGFWHFFNLGRLWPVILIVGGLLILSRK